MSEQEWLCAEMQRIVDRLMAEGAEGVILAVHYDNTKKNHFFVQTEGMLCVADGIYLGKAICETILEDIPKQEIRPATAVPAPEVQQ